MDRLSQGLQPILPMTSQWQRCKQHVLCLIKPQHCLVTMATIAPFINDSKGFVNHLYKNVITVITLGLRNGLVDQSKSSKFVPINDVTGFCSGRKMSIELFSGGTNFQSKDIRFDTSDLVRVKRSVLLLLSTTTTPNIIFW